MNNQSIQQKYDTFINTLYKEFQWPLQWCDGANCESYRKLGTIAREEWPGKNNEKWFNSDTNSLENGLKILYNVAQSEYNHIFNLIYEMANEIAKSEGGSVKKSTKKFGSRTRLGNYQGAMQTGAGFKADDSVRKLQTQLNYMFEGLILGQRTNGTGKLKETNSSIDKTTLHNAYNTLVGNNSSSNGLNEVWKEIEIHINWMNSDFMKGAEALYDNRWNRLVTFADTYYGSSTTSKSYYGKGQKSAMIGVGYTIGDSVTLKTKLKQPAQKAYKNIFKSGITVISMKRG